MSIRLIIGLGNPEPRYSKTYHNAGHIFIDYLLGHKELISDLSNIKIMKTNTSMNLSGKFVMSEMSRLSCES